MSTSNNTQTDQPETDLNTTLPEPSIKEVDESVFGWGFFHPSWLQCFNHRWWLVIVLFLYGFLAEVVVSGFAGATVSTLEKRFSLKSTEVGAFASCSEISAAVVGFIASYYANLKHKGRFLSIGALIFGIGTITFALPHFFVGQYQPVFTASNYTDLCIAKPTSFVDQVCKVNSDVVAPARRFYPLFIVAQLIMGAGYNLLFNIGYAYMDENVHPTSSAMYLAIMTTASAIGPGLGFIMASNILQIYVDTPSLPPPGLSPYDPRWIGAWWICFISFGFMIIAISIPLFAFPKHLPGFEKYKAKRQEMAGRNAQIDQQYGNNTKDILKATKALLTNVPYILIVAGNLLEYIIVAGFGYFIVKIIETRFHMAAFQGAVITGYIALASGIAGILLSGIVMKYFKMNGVAAIKLTWIISIADTLAILTYFMYCDTLPFAGINHSYPDVPVPTPATITKANLISSCNTDCMCKGVKYNPVCGVNGVTFYSPCHAGCSNSVYNPQYFTNFYFDCSCINNTVTAERPYDAVGGLCRKQCPELIPFLVGLTLSLAIMSAKIVPITEAMMRSVSESQRSFAVGFSWIFMRLLANIPAPLFVGAFFDQACLFWNKDCSTNLTACLLYDNRAITHYICGICLFIKISTTLCFFASWIFYKKDFATSYSDDVTKISDAKKDLGEMRQINNYL